MVVIQIETLHTLSVLLFTCFYVCELKKIVFREYLLRKIIRIRISNNKKKTVESSDIRLTFLSRSTEKQAGHDGKTAVID